MIVRKPSWSFYIWARLCGSLDPANQLRVKTWLQLVISLLLHNRECLPGGPWSQELGHLRGKESLWEGRSRRSCWFVLCPADLSQNGYGSISHHKSYKYRINVAGECTLYSLQSFTIAKCWPRSWKFKDDPGMEITTKSHERLIWEAQSGLQQRLVVSWFPVNNSSVPSGLNWQIHLTLESLKIYIRSTATNHPTTHWELPTSLGHVQFNRLLPSLRIPNVCLGARIRNQHLWHSVSTAIKTNGCEKKSIFRIWLCHNVVLGPDTWGNWSTRNQDAGQLLLENPP